MSATNETSQSLLPTLLKLHFVPQVNQQRAEKLKNWDNDFYVVGSLDTDHEKYQAASGRAREKFTKTKVPQTFNIAAPGNKGVKQKSMQQHHEYNRTRGLPIRGMEDKAQPARSPARRRPQTAPVGGRTTSAIAESGNRQPVVGSGSKPSLLSTPNRGASPQSPLMSPHLSPAPPPGMLPPAAGTQGVGVAVGAGAQSQQPRLVSHGGGQAQARAQAQAQAQGRSTTPLRRAGDDGAFDLDPELRSAEPLNSTDMRLIDELAGIAGDMYYLNR